MTTHDEVDSHLLRRMTAMWSKPTRITNGDLALAEYRGHLAYYSVDVLDAAWGDLRVRDDRWWPSLGEVDKACRRHLPSKYVARTAPPSWRNTLSTEAGRAAQDGDYAWAFVCFVRDERREPSEHETQQMIKAHGEFELELERLDVRSIDDPKETIWGVPVIRFAAWGRAIQARNERLSRMTVGAWS
jgi:hypothetical protein